MLVVAGANLHLRREAALLLWADVLFPLVVLGSFGYMPIQIETTGTQPMIRTTMIRAGMP